MVETFTWTPHVAGIMIACNILGIIITKNTICSSSEGLQLPYPKMFGYMNHAGMLAATSFGHVLGIGVIQGLAYSGYLNWIQTSSAGGALL